MPINRVSGASVYVHPETGRLCCARCDAGVAVIEVDRQKVSHTVQSPSVFCDNPQCPGYKVMGDVCIDTYPSSQHQRRAPLAATK